MAFPDDYLTDYLHADGVFDLTYTDAAGVETSGVKGQVDELTYQDAVFADGAGLKPVDQVWVVWAATLPDGDHRRATLTDAAGVRWEIKGTKALLVRGVVVRYRCYCVKLP